MIGTQPRDRLTPEIDSGQTRIPFRQGGATRAPLLVFSIAVATLVLAGSIALTSTRRSPARNLVAAVAPASLSHETSLGPVERPAGLAVGQDGTVYVVDSARNRVNVFAPDGRLTDTIGLPVVEGDERRGGQLTAPLGIVVDDTRGVVLVSDLANRRISEFSTNGAFNGYFGTDELNGGAPGVMFLRDDRVYVCDLERHRVLALSMSDGSLVASFGGPESVSMSYPNGVWVAENGTVYVSDSNNNRIHQFAADGQLERTIPLPIYNPRGIAVDRDGRFWVAATLDHKVVILDASGELDGELSIANTQEIGFPTSVVIQDERVFVTDRAGKAVQIWRLGR